MDVEASKSRHVWFQLVNHDGGPYENCMPGLVVLCNDSIIHDVMHAVHKCCVGFRQVFSVAQLRIFANRINFLESRQELDQDASIQSLGMNKEEALIVLIPELTTNPRIFTDLSNELKVRTQHLESNLNRMKLTLGAVRMKFSSSMK
jgi:hypothetical protein